MSADIPFEIQTEIIQRIPDAKSVIRCRSVSKAWKSVIDSKDFVTAHTLRHATHDQANCRLLIKTQDCKGCTCDSRCNPRLHYHKCNYTPVKYYSIVDDDDTFPHQKVSVFVPNSVDEFSHSLMYLAKSVILGSSYGLFCLYNGKKSTAVIWNPSIRKTVDIAVPNVLRKPVYRTVVGFGVCPRNLDPKLIKITHASGFSRLQDVNGSTQVEVFTLSSGGTWRSPLSSNIPHKSIQFGRQAVVDGFIYWDAMDRIDVDDGFRSYNVIMSFDLTSEEFTKVNLPDPLQLDDPYADLPLKVFNLRESLVVLKSELNRNIYHVWMMIGHGITRSFNKLYSVNAPDGLLRIPLGFRKSGAPIIKVNNDKKFYCKYEHALAMYEPESKSNTNIGIYGLYASFSVHSYTETLLLLGH